MELPQRSNDFCLRCGKLRPFNCQVKSTPGVRARSNTVERIIVNY